MPSHSCGPLRASCVRAEAKETCFPEGFTTHTIPLGVCLVALAFTGAGAFDCSYFSGATISFIGSYYGLWTLEDSDGKCQLWDVLFFAYDLGAPLVLARVFSMTAMLVGLAMVTTMAQASQIHLFSWGIGMALFCLFVVSVSTTDIFNVWTVFWWFSYIIMILIVRFLFIHPVHRRISPRGCKILAGFCVVNSVSCLLTLVVLKSDYCTCAGISAERLDGRAPGDPCEGSCRLGTAGYLTLVAAVLWLAGSICVVVLGVQPRTLKKNLRRPSHLFNHYPKESIVTRAKTGIRNVATNVAIRIPANKQHKSASSNAENKSSTSATSASEVSIIDEGDNPPIQSIKSAQSNSLRAINERFADEEDEDNQQHAPPVFFEDAVLPDRSVLEDDENSHAEDDDDGDRRSRCQRCCCDYRVKPRTRTEKIMFWTFRTGLALMIVIYVFMLFLMIGSRTENTAAAKRPDTTKYFTTQVVCAFDPANPWNDFQTFDSKAEAALAGFTVAHCGACSYCSNPHDIRQYVRTRTTIAKKSKECGPKVFLGTADDVSDCLESKIGFTRPCTKCWTDNMINTGQKCLNTCMRTLFSGFMTDNNVPGAGDEGWLNQCLFCDEKMSGPAFVTCSGVARRRLGIVSEIERNPEEQCQNVEVDWVNVDWESIGFHDPPTTNESSL